MKRLLLLFAAILMASTGMWAETVDYLYPVYNTADDPTSGIKEWKTASVDATVVEDAATPVTWGTAGETTWYVVKGSDVTLSQGAICSGNVHLILADGAKLTATGIDDVLNSTPGIQVSGDGNSLTVYVQTAQTGILKATGNTYSAGIGGNGADALQDGSNITINGGTVTAIGNGGAGIGGGLRGNGSNIIINGGTVTAKGSAAGIGGGNRGNGSNIIINGGTVTARGGDGSDGIGNGANATTPSSNIFVATWCIVKAGSSLTPTDVIENTGSDLATSLAGKQNVTIEPLPTVSASYVYPVYNDPDNVTNGIKEWKTGTVIASEIASSEDPVTWGVEGKTTWYVVTGNDVILSKGVICAGNVNLILADGAKLIVNGQSDQAGIQVSGTGNSLTIYGQSNQSGELIANGGDGAAGIGGGSQGSGSNITINGGTVTANGGYCAAGIGGGINASGSNITINGGTVTASGGTNAAGIGGGHGGSAASNIFVAKSLLLRAGNTKENTNVVCNSELSPSSGFLLIDVAYGLAGKRYATIEPIMPAPEEPKEITYIDEKGIEQTVKANVVSTSNISVIWGEPGKTTWYVVTHEDVQLASPVCQGDVRLILADYAKLTAVGYRTEPNANTNTIIVHAGIQVSGEDNSLTIYDQAEHTGQLVALGVEYAAGIGGGSQGSGSNITINGGIVTASGGNKAAGIGGGHGGSASNIKVATSLIVKADYNNPPTTVITNDGGDLASILADKQYVTITPAPVATYYVDESGKSHDIDAYVVYNSVTPATWGEKRKDTWYVVKGPNVQLPQGAICAGNVNLILADGAKLTAMGITDQILDRNNTSGIQVSGELNSLTIYGQAEHTGQLVALGGERSAGIGGGHEEEGSNITINGGTVTAKGGIAAAGIGGGIYGSASNITINGGTVTANGGGVNGIGSGLGGSASNIKVATDMTLKAGRIENPTDVIENNGGDLASILAGKQYVTITDKFNITANQDPNNKANYYSTFYSGKKAYSVPEGVTAYTGVVDGSVLKLTAIESGIIPAGEPVILRLTTEDNTATKQQFDLTAMTTTATKSGTNALTGTDEATTLSTNDYALSLGQNGVGFYLWNGKSIDAHKAYLTLDASEASAKAFIFQFDNGETTGIQEASPISSPEGKELMYDLNGVRVNDNHKGIVIKNGKKILKK